MSDRSTRELDRSAAIALARGAGHEPTGDLTSLPGGRNNRVFRMETSTGPLLLKAYFRHENDPRDRQGAEWRFATFAWERGVGRIAKPIAHDTAAGLSLFTFIEGRRLLPGEVAGSHMQQAIDWFVSLNEHRGHTDAERLEPASEACFSVGDHIARISARIERLTHIDGKSDIDREANAFVQTQLSPTFDAVRTQVERMLDGLSVSRDEVLPGSRRCLSPSDFGFHNALLCDDGQLVFHDFEYAGWDDPAKVLGDFFCQPAVPAPRQWLDAFVDVMVRALGLSTADRARMLLLLPVYRLKWCCIMLNEFLTTDAQRRAFAGDVADVSKRKAEQLELAREALRDVTG